LDGNVLELVGDDVEAVGEPVERGRVVVLRGQVLTEAADRRLLRGLEEPELEPERDAGEREHPAELASAENSDTHRQVEGSGCDSTFAVCSLRKRSSASRTSLRERATIEAARSAALIAPERPIASVPTGTPPG